MVSIPRPLSVLLAAGFLFPSCGKSVPDPERIRMTFSIENSGVTRVTSVSSSNEKKVENWALLLFRDGKTAGSGTSSSSAGITLNLEPGIYTACAVVNPPASFRPESVEGPDELEKKGIDLSDNAPDRFVMFGSRSVNVQAANGSTQTILVDRLVCKAGVRKITVDFSQPSLAQREFVLKAVYLTNCYREGMLGKDPAYPDLRQDASSWSNRMGFSSDRQTDALLADTDIDTPVTRNKPYGKAHCFYCLPNPVPENQDSRSGIWTVRRTRLVLEALIDGETRYWPVTLPVMERNKTYIADEIIIRSPGSTNPEETAPASVEAVFSASADDWSPLFDINETS